MNEITIHGRVTADPTCRYAGSGTAVINFSVAVNNRRYDKAQGQWIDRAAVFHNVVAFGEVAANAYECLTRGVLVTVTGTLSDDSYTKQSREPGGEATHIRRTQLEASHRGQSALRHRHGHQERAPRRSAGRRARRGLRPGGGTGTRRYRPLFHPRPPPAAADPHRQPTTTGSRQPPAADNHQQPVSRRAGHDKE